MTYVTPEIQSLVMKSDIMHIVAHEKGKPAVSRGRKTTDPGVSGRTAGLPISAGIAGLERCEEAATVIGPVAMRLAIRDQNTLLTLPGRTR